MLMKKKIFINPFFWFCFFVFSIVAWITKDTYSLQLKEYMKTEKGQKEFESMFPLWRGTNLLLFFFFLLFTLIIYKTITAVFGLSSPGLCVRSIDVLFEKNLGRYKFQVVKADTPLLPVIGLKIKMKEEIKNE